MEPGQAGSPVLAEHLPALALVAAWFGSLGITCVVVWKLFGYVESTASRELRDRAALWLMKPRESSTDWGGTFLAMFEAVFGERHWSWRCFGRSMLASCVAVLCVGLAVIGPELFSQIGHWRDASQLAVALALCCCTNILGDYVSLWETRFILRRLVSSRNSSAALLLCADLLLTMLIFAAFLWLFFFAAVALVHGEQQSVLAMFFISLVALIGVVAFFDDVAWVLLASTYVTSGWLCAFLLSRAVVGTLMPMRSRLSSFAQLLDIERQPFRSLGTASVLVVTATYIGVTLVAVIWSRW